MSSGSELTEADSAARARELWASAFPGRTADHLARLTGGEVNATYRLTSAGEEFVVRYPKAAPADWLPSVAGQVAAMTLAREAGVPVPEVLFASDEVLIYRHLPGGILTEADMNPELAFEAGLFHGLLHRIAGSGIGPVQADGSSGNWAVESLTRQVPAWAEYLTHHPTSPLAPAEVEEAADLIQEHWVAPRHCLLHGDASVWNTLVRDDRVIALIDFDEAWYGDPAGDLAWWWWSSPATADAFAAGCETKGEHTDPVVMWLYRIRHVLGVGRGLVDTALTDRAQRAADLLSVALAALRPLL